MKFKFLYSSIVLAFLAFAALSFSSGPTAGVGDKTGSPLSIGTCQSCHSNVGSFSPTMTLAIIDDVTSQPVTNGEYMPGRSYTLNFQVSASGAQYGMQATALLADSSLAGSLSNPSTGAGGTGSGAKITNSSSVDYLEHNTRSTDGLFNVTWTAPVAGSGDVVIYYAGLAVNANGSTSGDNFINGSMTLTEGIGTSITAIQSLEYNVYPNPVTNRQFNIQGIEGAATISVTDLAGRNVLSKEATLQANTPMSIQLANDLPSGVYTVSVVQNNQVGTKKLMLL